MTTEQLDDMIARLRWLYHQAEAAYRAGTIEMSIIMRSLSIATVEIEHAREALGRIEGETR